MQVQVQQQQVVATFEILPVLNQAKSKKEGRPIYDEQEVCRIRFPGNRHTAGCFPAHEVFRRGADETGMVTEITYAMEFNDAYKKFKAGEAQTVAGTPLAELTFLTAGKRLELKALNIHTAEQLAALDGANLKMLGMGGRDLKNQALAYLDTARQTADGTRLAEALQARDARIDELERTILEMKGGTVAPANIAPVASPFDGFGKEDLLNWLKDAEPAGDYDGRWSEERLRKHAEEVNMRLKAKAA